MNSEQPIDSLFQLISQGSLTIEDAQRTIEAAQLVGYLDTDRMSRWDHFSNPVGKDPDASDARAMPTSSIFWGKATADGIVFSFGPTSFTHIVRAIFDQPIVLGLPGQVVARLCHLAGKVIRSTPVEYSFASAMAHCLEREGDRSTAQRVWEPYSELVPSEWAAEQFEALFLETRVNSSDPDELRAEDVATLQETIEEGRRDEDELREYLGLRMLTLIYAQYGQFEKSFNYAEQAISRSMTLSNPTARLLFGGDLFWLMSQSQPKEYADQFVSVFMDGILTAPAYVGNAALFARSAHLCASHGYTYAQWQCICRLSECIA